MSVFFGVGSPGTIGPASGGKIYGFNTLSTALVLVAPANPARTKIQFHNPGTVDIFIAPALIQTSGSSVPFIPSPSALGGTIRLFANGGWQIIDGECQGAWNAFALAGSSNPLTVIDSNI